MPRCRNCKDKFTARYFNQKYCMYKDECIKAHSNAVQDKIKKTEAKKWAQIKKEKKAALKTLTDWKKDLQDVINEIVRLIDKDCPCMMCSDSEMKRINACHYHSRGSHPALQFHLLNNWAGCSQCNNEKGGNLHGYDMLLIEKFGRERWEYIKFELTRLYGHLGITIPEIKEVLPEAKQIRSELKSTNLVYTYEMRWKLRVKYNKRLGIYE